MTETENTTEHGKLRVLIVDDHHFLRTAVQRMLLSLGVKEVLQANDGQRALDILQGEDAQTVDVVMCDLDMPGMDGMEFLRHLATARAMPLSVIIISGLESALISSVEKMAMAYGLRLLGAIEKPLSLVELETLLTLHHQRQDALQQPHIFNPCSLEEILEGVRLKQFEPFFQPKVNFKTEHVVGAEALARWRHPKHGLLEPKYFIPLLEQADQMDSLTFLMLEEAVVACHLLHELGHAISISINLSLTSLNDPSLADRITQTVRSAGVDPKNIVLEITESATMTDAAHALENLARLRMRGFGLSIDDYGTGYSSMQQLTRIAFSELKIDSSFIKDVSENKSLHIIVASSIDMASKLQVNSVAEGVESQLDWNTLKSMGCDTAQGYFIAHPMDLTGLLEFCATH
jgi:EAL domain-containing protein (putative c-di-GMP-specific phosphodiesterase class I)